MTNSHARTPWTDRQRREPCPRVNNFFFRSKTDYTIATGGLVNPSNEVTKEDKHVILDHG
jgi:hypothetical protein